jgi:shikimate dehydrogenase
MTEVMFVIGHGISHSLSPAMWNHLFESTGRPIRYERRDVDEGGLPSVLEELRSGNVLAANVTMPHKAWAAEIANERDAAVTATGAANLLIPSLPILRALNTDVTGARTLLAPRAPFERVLVLGAGGTAVALLEALVGLATEVTVANRTEARAEALAERYRRRFGRIAAVAWDEREKPARAADLVVNTVPAVDRSSLDLALLRSHAVLYDVIYRREPTVMQNEANRRGVPLADGLAHLAAQAIAMLEPLAIEADAGPLLVRGLERATDRSVLCWGSPLT